MTTQISTQLQTVSFYGTNLITLKFNDVAYTAIRPIVEALGLSWGSQSIKLNKNREKFGCFDIETPTNGGIQSMLCMPIKKLNGWLFSINPEKVRPDLKEKVIQYQEECFEALYNYWHFGKAERKTTVDDRTGLRNAVNMLVSKKGLIYSDAYNLVHQYMNVETIEDIPADKLQSAVEYVHRIVLEGELITEQKKDELFTREFTEHDLQQLVWAWFALWRGMELCQNLLPALNQIGSHYSASVYGVAYEYRSTLRQAHNVLTRITEQFECEQGNNWYVLKYLRAYNPKATGFQLDIL